MEHKKSNASKTNVQTTTTTTAAVNKANNELKIQQQQQQQNNFITGVISRERSFVRTSNQQNNSNSKRRSLAFNMQQHPSGQQQQQQQQQQLRIKPAMDIYRPPSLRNESAHVGHVDDATVCSGGTAVPNDEVAKKLNVHAPDFYMSSKSVHIKNTRSSVVFPSQQPFATAPHMLNRRQAGLSLSSAIPLTAGPLNKGAQRPILAGTHMHGMTYVPLTGVSQHLPLINSPSSGNILTQTSVNRVKFAAEPEKRRTVNFSNNYNNNQQQQQYLHQHPHHHQQQQQQHKQYINQTSYNIANGMDPYNNLLLTNPLQRSKSLSSADALTRSIAGLGLGLGNEITDIGQFTPDIQALIDIALDDPNKLNSRCLMELSIHFMKRAVEERRYALPIARCCLNIMAKEHKETFLEALLNTCRQWYQEREKLLFIMQGMKNPSRGRFTAFMAFLTEMFCQLKRRQLQLRTQCEGVSPPLVLLTLLAKCCEDCVKPPVRSSTEIECLFYVMTCIGQDLEQHLPQQLESLLSQIRDAFLSAGDSSPQIRRNLLQLIELQASHWQLPGNTVLYYYPANNQLQRT